MDEKKQRENSSGSEVTATNIEDARRGSRKKSFTDVDPDKLSAAFENPLEGLSREQLFQDVEKFCQEADLMEHLDDFRKGALVAQSPRSYGHVTELSDEDRNILDREVSHRWSQPFTLYWLVVMCSMAAAVQGMDETVNNGAQALYLDDLGVTTARFDTGMQDNLTGLIVGAPYLCCAILGCWLTEPLNKVLGRRGTIFLSCAIAAIASIWEGVANSWVNLFIARFVLGLGIGPKSSTVPWVELKRVYQILSADGTLVFTPLSVLLPQSEVPLLCVRLCQSVLLRY